MKIEEQKKAVRSGYDMDIIPSDLATFGSEAKNLLQDLQSRNERMFLLTFLVVNMADTKRKLDNDIFATAGFAQKNNCALTRLDYLQEAGFMSSIPLGENLIINNTPTVDELEAKVKAGEQISLVDLAEAIKADKERGKEKPSIRAQLKADKERTGKKKNTKQKSQDLERS